MREVDDAAWEAPGVDRIVDHLVVGAVSALASRLAADGAPHASLLGEEVPVTLRADGHPFPSDAGTPRRSANALG